MAAGGSVREMDISNSLRYPSLLIGEGCRCTKMEGEDIVVIETLLAYDSVLFLLILIAV